MTLRIVLSSILLLLLAAGSGYALADDPAPAPTADGIGTSPSFDDDPLAAAAAPTTDEQHLMCGVWLDTSLAAADARSLAGEPPDILVFTTARTGCSDAVSIAWNLYPGRAFVRAVVWQGWRAREAPPPHASYTVPEQLPELQAAAFPWLILITAAMPLIQAVIGKLFTTQVKSDSRRAQILSYADTAFQVVEVLGRQLGLSGQQKYLRFVEQVINSLKAAGLPELSAQEMQVLQQLAQSKAYLTKAPAMSALPLPPPPRG